MIKKKETLRERMKTSDRQRVEMRMRFVFGVHLLLPLLNLNVVQFKCTIYAAILH